MTKYQKTSHTLQLKGNTPQSKFEPTRGPHPPNDLKVEKKLASPTVCFFHFLTLPCGTLSHPYYFVLHIQELEGQALLWRCSYAHLKYMVCMVLGYAHKGFYKIVLRELQILVIKPRLFLIHFNVYVFFKCVKSVLKKFQKISLWFLICYV